MYPHCQVHIVYGFILNVHTEGFCSDVLMFTWSRSLHTEVIWRNAFFQCPCQVFLLAELRGKGDKLKAAKTCEQN